MHPTRSVGGRSARARTATGTATGTAIRAAACALVTGFAACTDMPAAEAPLSDEAAAAGQAAPTDEPWFGVMLPPGFEPHALQVISARPAAPAVVPEGESGYRALAGAAIQASLETSVGFSRESEESREVGEGQMWGRITGFPSGSKTVEWAVSEFRAAGIADVELQEFDQGE